MSRGGKRKNQTGRPKNPYRVKRMSVPEPLVDTVKWMVDCFERHDGAKFDVRAIGNGDL